MEIPFKLPFYAKTALIFISVLSFGFIMYIGQDIIIPIVYATIFAILLNPFVNFLTRKKINKIIAISIAVSLTILAVLVILEIIFSRMSMFSETYPQLKLKLGHTSDQFVQWISHKLNYSQAKINKWIGETQTEAISNIATGERLSQLGQLSITLVLLPVYLFMILYYKSLLLEFIRKLFRQQHHTAVVEVLTNSKNIIQSYLVGLVFEMAIMAALNAGSLLILGIDYALILGILVAIVNIIPYIGGIIAILLPMIMAFVTKDSLMYPLLVFVIAIFIQFIDNHYIIPKIVASRVQINALISVIGVLVGGAIWGISGMFLSIPLIAILKVIFDHIEPLKPWGFLLGNIVPTNSKFSFIKRKIKN
ncbi:MAG: AI-2E family transporter [Ferruginibacter sp.]